MGIPTKGAKNHAGAVHQFPEVAKRKHHKFGGLTKQKFYSLTIPEAESPKSRCGQCHSPLEDSIRQSVVSSCFWVLLSFLGVCWPVAASHQSPPPPFPVLSSFLCFPLTKTLSTGFRAHQIIQNHLLISLKYIYKDLFPNKILGIGTRRYLLAEG